MILRRRVMESGGKEYPLGIWAYYSDGSIKDYEHADRNAIGVALVTNNVAFVISKMHETTVKFGGYGIDLSGYGITLTSDENTAKADFDGESNTAKIIDALSGITDSDGTVGAMVCEECRARFDGKGYLGSAGEWNEVYANKSAINNMFEKISGRKIFDDSYWTSTLRDASYKTWRIGFWNGTFWWYSRNTSNVLVRAFMPLK